MELGLTLWFSDNGDKHKALGIHYPLGNFAMLNHNPDQKDSSEVSSLKDTLTLSMKDEIELIGPEKNKHLTLSFEDALKQAIVCKTGNAGDNLVYELQFPLLRTDSYPFGITVNKIKSLEICFEMGKIKPDKKKQIEEEKRKRDRQQAEPGSGLIRDASGYSTMMRRNRMMRDNPSLYGPNPLEMWLKVNLAGNIQGKS